MTCSSELSSQFLSQYYIRALQGCFPSFSGNPGFVLDFCLGLGFSHLFSKTRLLFFNVLLSEANAGVGHTTGAAVSLCVPIFNQDSQLENWKQQNAGVEVNTQPAVCFCDFSSYVSLTSVSFSFFIPQVYLFDLTYKQRPYTFLLPKKCHTSGGEYDASVEVSGRQREIMYYTTLFRGQPSLSRNKENEAGVGCCCVVVSAVQFIP